MIYFVTGGSRGIGAAIVLRAIEEGHDVAFTYLNNETPAHQVVEQALKLRSAARCKCYRMDVRDVADVERVGNQVLDDFESVDVIVNNAGINRDNLAASMSDEEWHDVINTNLHGPFYVIRFFLTTLLANHFGRIINISSVSASGATGQVNYAAAKSGLSGLTRSLAKEYGPKNITANLVIAGFFDTDMTRGTMSQKSKEFWLNLCPKRRVGDLCEISRVVTFLGSEASSFINGAEIPVTGGLDHAP
jgi:NAD(P)-dependent dehydrogenase (short-subunit alcohol dehydrogenase family)